MTPLPPWADNPEARALLAAIRIEQPECLFVRRYDPGNREPWFKGMNARKLRAMWEAACEAAMEAGDREAYARLAHYEHCDDVIERALAEPVVPYSRMEIEERPDGSARVAA